MRVTKGQAIKSSIFTVLGALPGIGAFLLMSNTMPIGMGIVILCLGMFIGFALSLPGVSAVNVLKGTGGMIAASNAPRSLQGKILNATFEGDEEQPEETDSNSPGVSPKE